MHKEEAKIKHIAFIMDGNGRWAEARGMSRERGHKYGAEALKTVLRRLAHHGIEVATFYAFSTENWKRPKKEVDSLMALFGSYLSELTKDMDKHDIRYRFIGDMSAFSADLRAKIQRIEKSTSDKKFIVNIALNYGAKSELVHAVNTLVANGMTQVSEEDIDSSLYTAGMPPLDLLVRTGGELRLSNFLLWQAAYAELYFTDTLWPDMDADAVDAAVEAFYKRKRRYGGV